MVTPADEAAAEKAARVLDWELLAASAMEMARLN